MATQAKTEKNVDAKSVISGPVIAIGEILCGLGGIGGVRDFLADCSQA